MRQGQSLKRGRGQRRKQGGNVNRALDSSGPEVKIRGTASQIYEKYLQLSRDAGSAGDRIKAENFLQHAEHYFRIMRAMQPAQPPAQEGVSDTPQPRSGEEVEADGPQPNVSQPVSAANGSNANGAAEPAAENAADGANGKAPRAPRRRRPKRAPSGDGDEAASTEASASEPAEAERAANGVV